MRRRDVITLLGGAAAAWPVAVHAQRPRRVGVLTGAADDPQGRSWIAGFDRSSTTSVGRTGVICNSM